MRPAIKHLIVTIMVVLTSGMTANAQHRGGGRLPRILDPLGILPSPRQVLRTLDHVARALPPVVIETRGLPDGNDNYEGDYRRYSVRDFYEPAPYRQFASEFEPNPIHHYGRGYRYEQNVRRGHHFPSSSSCNHDRSGFRGSR
jgi:hypothetical protein